MNNAALFFIVCVVALTAPTTTVAWMTTTPTTPQFALYTQSTQFLQQQQQQPAIRTSSRSHTTTSSLRMVSNLFQKGGASSSSSSSSSSNTEMPRDVKDAVSKCRASTQQALQNRLSRMAIEFPVGTQFGVEKVDKKKKKQQQQQSLSAVTSLTKTEYDTSNRELARLFVEMFQPVGAERITVVFESLMEAQDAKTVWKKTDSYSMCRVTALDRTQSKQSKKISKTEKKKQKSKGFAAKLAQELDDNDESSTSSNSNNDDSDDDTMIIASSGPFALPENTEVAVFVAPPDTPKTRQTLQRICDSVGMGTLVILLNARWFLSSSSASSDSKASSSSSSSSWNGLVDDFEPVFCLAAAPQDAAPGCILYRAYPNPWIMARKAKLGPPKPILTATHLPDSAACQAAYDALELSELEKGVESVLENVATWFR